MAWSGLVCYALPVPMQINVYQAKTHLSELLDRVERGEEIVLARSGRPVARLVPLQGERAARQPGGWRGRVELAADFDELPAALLHAFEGRAL